MLTYFHALIRVFRGHLVLVKHVDMNISFGVYVHSRSGG